jgi:pimeloyl-ACP methyl ester carboxylesterase
MQRAATTAVDVSEWWDGGKAPILVIQGLQDAIAPPANARALKAQFGDRVTLVEIDGSGHAMLPEQPGVIASNILQFLAQLQK